MSVFLYNLANKLCLMLLCAIVNTTFYSTLFDMVSFFVLSVIVPCYHALYERDFIGNINANYYNICQVVLEKG